MRCTQTLLRLVFALSEQALHQQQHSQHDVVLWEITKKYLGIKSYFNDFEFNLGYKWIDSANGNLLKGSYFSLKTYF